MTRKPAVSPPLKAPPLNVSADMKFKCLNTSNSSVFSWTLISNLHSVCCYFNQIACPLGSWVMWCFWNAWTGESHFSGRATFWSAAFGQGEQQYNQTPVLYETNSILCTAANPPLTSHMHTHNNTCVVLSTESCAHLQVCVLACSQLHVLHFCCVY